MATLTLRRMADGGINDQLGGGFCRYAVDEFWMIPHFEKMLYDNGELLGAYAQAALATGDADYARVAADDRRVDAARDAGAGGRLLLEPGRGFGRARGQVLRLGARGSGARRSARPNSPCSHRATGSTRPANFEGQWHLYVATPLAEIAAATQQSPEAVASLLAAARAKLLAVRDTRVRPARDEKVLTSWNALMIRGMAISARALARPELADSAARALDFLRRTHWRDGRLLATSKDGEAHLNAYLDDYAYLADAILELQQVRFRADELQLRAGAAGGVAAALRGCGRRGFLLHLRLTHETLIHRSKTFGDDATPAGNGIAATALLRFGYLLGEPRYLAAAERTLRAFWLPMTQHPQTHASLLVALEEVLHPTEIVILRGEAAPLADWGRQLARAYAPRRVVLAIPTGATGLPPALAEKAARDGTVAYVCRGSSCSAPLSTLEALLAELSAARS